MSDYLLLTGATGLLGRYLLRDLLLGDVDVAVLVRHSRRQSAEQRVDGLLAAWEQNFGFTLPRPVVLDGDICQSGLGLNDADRKWVMEHCDSVLHNAASLTFHSTDTDSEPWRSNVRGVENVLELCRAAEIRDFHHVSTAYVCGLRHGQILESDVDVGQTLGNDYERSKLEAENLVRSADFLSPPTVYRPAIIVGDSRTGFTTTFHGFYAALHLAYTLSKAIERDENGYFESRVRMTLDGNESKNLVPVDWVSAVIAHIVMSPEYHGKTYHLTPPEPVTVRILSEVLGVSNNFGGTVFLGGNVPLDNPNELEKLFYEHIQVYDSYWRDDPVFDRTNALDAAPHLPCPSVDKALLLRLAQAAMDMEFRWKDPVVAESSAVRT